MVYVCLLRFLISFCWTRLHLLVWNQMENLDFCTLVDVFMEEIWKHRRFSWDIILLLWLFDIKILSLISLGGTEEKEYILPGFILDIIILILWLFLNLFIAFCTWFITYWIVVSNFFAKNLTYWKWHLMSQSLEMTSSSITFSISALRTFFFPIKAICKCFPECFIICYIICINFAKEYLIFFSNNSKVVVTSANFLLSGQCTLCFLGFYNRFFS